MLAPAGTGGAAAGVAFGCGCDAVELDREALAGVEIFFSDSSCSFSAFFSALLRARPMVSGITEDVVAFLLDLTSLLPRELVVDVASSIFLVEEVA